MDPDNGGLFAINLSDEEETKPRPPRKTHQTDAEFQAVKKSYSAKVENGNIHKTAMHPLPNGVNKLYVQEVLHAVEELYFFGKFHEAAEYASRVLREADGLGDDGPHGEARELLESYERRCRKRCEKVV